MTSEATAAVSTTPEDTKPAPWATHEIAGRTITFVAPTPEQLMVLRRLSRQLDDETNVKGQLITLAKVLDAVSACIATDDDRDFVDQLVLDRKAGVDELAPLIVKALRGPNADKATAPKNGPARRVRRR